jgi:hypothetical protein
MVVRLCEMNSSVEDHVYSHVLWHSGVVSQILKLICEPGENATKTSIYLFNLSVLGLMILRHC